MSKGIADLVRRLAAAGASAEAIAIAVEALEARDATIAAATEAVRADARARKAAQRARKSIEGESRDCHVTSPDASECVTAETSDVTVKSVTDDVTQEAQDPISAHIARVEDNSQDTNTPQIPTVSWPPEHPKTKKSTSPGTPCPPDFYPSERNFAVIAAGGMARHLAEARVVPFRNYWIGRNEDRPRDPVARKKDWGRAFENWCLNDLNRAPRAPPFEKKGSIFAAGAEVMRDLYERDR